MAWNSGVVYRGIIVHNKIHIKYQSFSPFIKIGSPPSPYPASECLSPPPPPTCVLGGATLACGWGGGGTQFRRRYRHSGMYSIIPLRVEDYIGRGTCFPTMSETPPETYIKHMPCSILDSDIRKSLALCHLYTSTFRPLHVPCVFEAWPRVKSYTKTGTKFYEFGLVAWWFFADSLFFHRVDAKDGLCLQRRPFSLFFCT